MPLEQLLARYGYGAPSTEGQPSPQANQSDSNPESPASSDRKEPPPTASTSHAPQSVLLQEDTDDHYLLGQPSLAAGDEEGVSSMSVVGEHSKSDSDAVYRDVMISSRTTSTGINDGNIEISHACICHV